MKRDSRPSKRSDSHIQKQLAGIGHVTGGASLVLCRHVARPRANAAHFHLLVGNFAYSSSSTCWQSANKAIQMSFLAGARSVECTAGDRGWLVCRAAPCAVHTRRAHAAFMHARRIRTALLLFLFLDEVLRGGGVR